MSKETPRTGPVAHTLLAMTLALSGAATHAQTFNVRPIDFGNGIVASGALVVDDASGAIVDWNLVVTTTTELAHYTPANAPLREVSMLSASADGVHLSVRTSPDSLGGADGGVLSFHGGNPFSPVAVRVADFTSLAGPGGESGYVTPFTSDVLALGQADGIDYQVASRAPGAAARYLLNDVGFSAGVTMSGSVTTDGTLGDLSAGNLSQWDIVVRQVTQDVFNPGNSSLLSEGVGLSADGSALIADNPGGLLEFDKGAIGGHKFALTLADLVDGSFFAGTAGYFQGALAVYTVDLGAGGAPWRLTGTEPVPAPVPLPAGWALLLSATACGAGLARRRQSSLGAA